MSADAIQDQVNVTRCVRTREYAMKYNIDALKDPTFSYRSDIITKSLYCACKDCVKFRCYGKPIKCIDPYLMDMRFTHWIYQGLVAASTTVSPRVDSNIVSTTSSTSTNTASTVCSEEPKPKRRKC